MSNDREYDPLFDSTITVTVLDTVTGETGVMDGRSPYQWWEGNWGCDCNRESCFPSGAAANPDGQGPCGYDRYLVVAVKGLDPRCGLTGSDFNNGHPEDIVKKHLPNGVAIS